MIVGIDTSGKIDQLPMWIGVVRPMQRGILDNLRKSVGGRAPVLLARRRLDGKYLNQEEIETLKKNVNLSSKVLRAPAYASCLWDLITPRSQGADISISDSPHAKKSSSPRRGCDSNRQGLRLR